MKQAQIPRMEICYGLAFAIGWGAMASLWRHTAPLPWWRDGGIAVALVVGIIFLCRSAYMMGRLHGRYEVDALWANSAYLLSKASEHTNNDLLELSRGVCCDALTFKKQPAAEVAAERQRVSREALGQIADHLRDAEDARMKVLN